MVYFSSVSQIVCWIHKSLKPAVNYSCRTVKTEVSSLKRPIFWLLELEVFNDLILQNMNLWFKRKVQNRNQTFQPQAYTTQSPSMDCFKLQKSKYSEFVKLSRSFYFLSRYGFEYRPLDSRASRFFHFEQT